MGDTHVKITDKTFCSTSSDDSIYGFFIDGEFLYFCISPELATEFLVDIVNSYEAKFKKANPDYRVFVEKANDWKYTIQRARDGIFTNGKPRQTHIFEIKRAQKLLKPILDN